MARSSPPKEPTRRVGAVLSSGGSQDNLPRRQGSTRSAEFAPIPLILAASVPFVFSHGVPDSVSEWIQPLTEPVKTLRDS
jgi:hypothetical protein